MRPDWHRVTVTDQVAKRGICSVCGPVGLRRRERRGAVEWSCGIKRRQGGMSAAIWERIEPQANGCWQWTGRLDKDGYGRHDRALAYRQIWLLLRGAISDGFELDHLCRNRACVNPDHLEVVTHLENMRRSAPAQKTRCANGHPYDEANTYLRPNGCRDCRACNRDRSAGYRANRAAGVSVKPEAA